MATYTTHGTARGSCGHSHRTMAAAAKCRDADIADCAALGGGHYSDRRVRRLVNRRPAPLTEADRATLDEIDGVEPADTRALVESAAASTPRATSTEIAAEVGVSASRVRQIWPGGRKAGRPPSPTSRDALAALGARVVEIATGSGASPDTVITASPLRALAAWRRDPDDAHTAEAWQALAERLGELVDDDALTITGRNDLIRAAGEAQRRARTAPSD